MKEQTQNGQVANDLVTQKELQELAGDEVFTRQVELRRKSIRNRILAGAKVEPGSCSVCISESQTIHLTSTTITKLLGPLSDQVLAALPRQQIRRMKLDPDTHTKHKTKPKAVFDPAAMESSDESDQEFDLNTFVLEAPSLLLEQQGVQPLSSAYGSSVTDGFDDLDEFDGILEGIPS